MAKCLFGLFAGLFSTAVLAQCPPPTPPTPPSANGHIGVQLGNPPGFSSGLYTSCAAATACTAGTGALSMVNGTVTVKRAGIEVLLSLQCGGVMVWAGERFQGTSDIQVNFPAGLINGPCYVSWQEDNNTTTTVPGGDFEYQFTTN